MKRVKLLFSALVILALGAMAQPQLHWRFANPTTFTSGTDCVMQFDVELSCDAALTYHSSMMVYFDYNPAVFGNTIVANSKITYTAGALMDLMVFGSPGYSWVNQADNTPTRYALTTEANFVVANPMFMEEVPLYPAFASFATFQIVIGTPGPAGIAFTPNTGPPTFVGLMDGNQFYVDAGHPAETPYGIPPNYAGFYDNDLLNFDASCGPPPANMWTGAVSNDWFLPANWSFGTVPVMSDDVVIPDVAKAPFPVIFAGAAAAATLTINPMAMLVIDTTGNLTVTGLTTNNGTLLIESWWVEEDHLTPIVPPSPVPPYPPDNISSKSGSFIDNGLAGTGYWVFRRNLPSRCDIIDLDPDEGRYWNYVGIPNEYEESVVFWHCFLKEWSEPAGLWSDVDGCWEGNIPLGAFAPAYPSPLKGYSTEYCDYLGGNPTPDGYYKVLSFGDFDGMTTIHPGVIQQPYWDSDYERDFLEPKPCGTNTGFMGTLGLYTLPPRMFNTGPAAITLNALGGVYNGWNLLGNPYPSALDIEAFSIPLGMDATIYYWDDYDEVYRPYTQGVGGPGSRYIPPTQGFMAHATIDGTVFGVNNAQRTHTGQDLFWKNSDDILVLSSGVDETWIAFNENATNGFDSKFDAYKLFSNNPEIPMIFTSMYGTDMATNSLPATDVVPLSFKVAASGTYSIYAKATGSFSTILLEDLKTGIITDLLANPTYVFSYTAGEEPARFLVHFAPLGIGDADMYKIDIFSRDNNIVVKAAANFQGEVHIYNALGQEVLNSPVSSGTNEFAMSEVNTCYIVKVVTSRSVISEKVYIR